MRKTKSMPQVVIVSPALRETNNGNWQTARRWQQHLAGSFRTRIVKQWPDTRAADDDVMIALHARRSADSIAAWAKTHPGQGLALALTGTDLYRDIRIDAAAQRSLALAQVLVVLQERGALALPGEVRAKTRVIFQSTTPRQTLPKSARHLRAVVVGHLREEKSPETIFSLARLLSAHRDIFIDHIGDALQPELAEAASSTMTAAPNYRWLGNRPHEEVRRRLQRAHLLIHPSRMEGGAHVIMEAIASGTPVLASAIDGNIGMLGADYTGYFPLGDSATLADTVLRCHESRRWQDGASLLEQLAAQCRERARLFQPATERAALLQLLDDLRDTR